MPLSKKNRKARTLLLSADFAGIGVIGLACRKMRVKFQFKDVCDISAKCRAVFQKLFPETVHMHSDVTKREKLRKCDLLMLTPPCQDFSSEGKRLGCKKKRGRLIRSSLKAIKKLKRKRRPRAIILENVASLLTNRFHRRTMVKPITKKLKAMGYSVRWRLLLTSEHGVPQTRRRAWLVAIKKRCCKHRFCWPSPIPLRYTMPDVLGRQEEDCWRKPRTKFGTSTRRRVHALMRRAKRKHFRSAAQMVRSVSETRLPLLVDIDCSESRARSSADGMAWTLTATRGQSGGPFVANLGRRTNVTEMMWMQGIDAEDVVPALDQCPNLKPSTVGHMLGNATSLNVTERLLRQVLISIGFAKESELPDRWADKTVEVFRERCHWRGC